MELPFERPVLTELKFLPIKMLKLNLTLTNSTSDLTRFVGGGYETKSCRNTFSTDSAAAACLTVTSTC